MSNYCDIIWPEKFNGHEKNLKKFSYSLIWLVRSISGKTTRIIQCIERPTLQYLEELDPVFNYEILKNVLLQRSNANEPDFMLKYYQTVFHERLLSEMKVIRHMLLI